MEDEEELKKRLDDLIWRAYPQDAESLDLVINEIIRISRELKKPEDQLKTLTEHFRYGFEFYLKRKEKRARGNK